MAKTLIDADFIVWAVASACDNTKWNYKGRQWDYKDIATKVLLSENKDPKELYQTKEPEPWDKVETTLIKYVDDIIDNLEDPFDMHFLVSGGGKNFRYDIATILPYKGNRLQELPFHFQKVKDFLCETYGAKKIYRVETDDAIGILYEEGDTIVSVDKDLDQLPGKHHNPKTNKKYEITREQGLKSFYQQLLTGDSTDNILGLYGVGPKSTYLTTIEKASKESEIYELIDQLYSSRFGSYWPRFALENARLLWLLRGDGSLPYIIEAHLEDLSFYTQEWRDKIFVE